MLIYSACLLCGLCLCTQTTDLCVFTFPRSSTFHCCGPMSRPCCHTLSGLLLANGSTLLSRCISFPHYLRSTLIVELLLTSKKTKNRVLKTTNDTNECWLVFPTNILTYLISPLPDPLYCFIPPFVSGAKPRGLEHLTCGESET